MDRTVCTEPQCLYKGDLYLYLYIKLQEVAIQCVSTWLLAAFRCPPPTPRREAS